MSKPSNLPQCKSSNQLTA